MWYQLRCYLLHLKALPTGFGPHLSHVEPHFSLDHWSKTSRASRNLRNKRLQTWTFRGASRQSHAMDRYHGPEKDDRIGCDFWAEFASMPGALWVDGGQNGGVVNVRKYIPWEPNTFIFRGYNPYIGGWNLHFSWFWGPRVLRTYWNWLNTLATHWHTCITKKNPPKATWSYGLQIKRGHLATEKMPSFQTVCSK